MPAADFHLVIDFLPAFLQILSMENLARKLMTAAEYLEMERNSSVKHEFYRGEIFAMAGAKERHNLIVSNLIIAFGIRFKNQPCVVYPSDMRVEIDENHHYTYPDVVLVCGERKFSDSKNDTLLNPNVIFEVLSESTESYDRSKKFEAYRTIPSLQEYVLVSSDRKKIEVFTKSPEGRWYLSESGLSDTVEISAVNTELLLSEVYDKIVFDEQASDSLLI